ncbi:MAG: AAA family ATPase [Muribaculaceae bacterium]|nr:AAA family ATPase [Muribaculaceae bacterium]
MKDYRYKLGRITGICPSCGKRRFKYYIDSRTGRIIDPECGRCNREHSCGYHRTPREAGIQSNSLQGFATAARRKEPSHLPTPTLDKPPYCPLTEYLRRLFGKEPVDRWCRRMGVDTFPDDPRKTIFWLLDRKGVNRSGKMMAYGDDGHRLHGKSDTGYMHKAFAIPGYDFEACFFGEHLAAAHPHHSIILVESEKSALMMNIVMDLEGYSDRYICLATSGASNVRPDKSRIADDPWYRLNILNGRRVILLPDADMVDSWSEAAEALRPYTSSVLLLDPRKAPFCRTGSEDVADYLVERAAQINYLQSEHSETEMENTSSTADNTIATADTTVTTADTTERYLIIKDANSWITESMERPDPKPLWRNIWYENEVCCLFADTNVGKSILAVQIADEVSRSRNVVYFDFEMTDKQFQMRYTDSDTGRPYPFSDKLFRAELSTDYNYRDIEGVIDGIRRVADRCGSDTIIIDNLTWLCNRAETGEAAGEFMQLLIKLKRDHGFSVLVLAHTPKSRGESALTIDRLAGSKRIANFMDAVFAIGVSTRDRVAERYLIHLKSRSSAIEYTSANVMLMRLVKEGPMLKMEHTGYTSEGTLIAADTSTDEIRSQRMKEVEERLRQGQTYAQIQAEMHITPRLIAEVNRRVKTAAA